MRELGRELGCTKGQIIWKVENSTHYLQDNRNNVLRFMEASIPSLQPLIEMEGATICYTRRFGNYHSNNLISGIAAGIGRLLSHAKARTPARLDTSQRAFI
jgi:hypothetical protein